MDIRAILSRLNVFARLRALEERAVLRNPNPISSQEFADQFWRAATAAKAERDREQMEREKTILPLREEQVAQFENLFRTVSEVSVPVVQVETDSIHGAQDSAKRPEESPPSARSSLAQESRGLSCEDEQSPPVGLSGFHDGGPQK